MARCQFSANGLVCACLLAAGLVSTTALAGRTLMQAPANLDTSNLPQECVQAALDLQNACAKELDAGTKFFGLGSDTTALQGAANITQAQIQKYFSTAPPPDPACCKAACTFNANLCSCNPQMLALIGSFTGNNQNVYISLSQALAQACKFTAYILGTTPATCPPNASTAPKPYGPACK